MFERTRAFFIFEKKSPMRIVLFLVTLALFSCKKDRQDLKDGTYKGTFKANYTQGTQEGPVTIVINGNNYQCSTGTDNIPGGGSGSFSQEKKTIIFTDVNNYTADFDWNLILNGTYGYTFDGSRLKLVNDRVSGAYYEYDVEKQ